MWEKIFMYKKNEFPNLCIMAELVMVLSGSNSSVERAFSLLTLLLTDRRSSLSHKTMEDLMVININNKLWTPLERENIIKDASDKYESAKRQVRQIDDSASAVPMEISDEGKDSGSSEEDEDDIFS